ncbi:hypothetical protein VE03_01316 [Pseudogymnoascus sp. 23342-1-I1]|nr:hypothetical protein VE03_01316 [Pseudogymnoascus sp. 23342-1-I1]
MGMRFGRRLSIYLLDGNWPNLQKRVHSEGLAISAAPYITFNRAGGTFFPEGSRRVVDAVPPNPGRLIQGTNGRKDHGSSSGRTQNQESGIRKSRLEFELS